MAYSNSNLVKDIEIIIRQRLLNPFAEEFKDFDLREPGLEAVIRKKSQLLMQARLLESSGKADDAIALYKQVAEKEEWIAERLLEQSKEAEAAVNLVSAASCWYKAGNCYGAIRLLDTVLSLDKISEALREESLALREAWLKSLKKISIFAYKKRASQETSEGFKNLLTTLDPDLSKAGEKYTEIHRRLLLFFEMKSCKFPEELADETIKKVEQKIAEGLHIPTEKSAVYFYGTAKLLLRDYWKQQREASSLDSLSDRMKPNGEDEKQRELLSSEFQRLSEKDSQLILAYYQEDGDRRPIRRRELAAQLRITQNALTLRIARLRQKLRESVKNSLHQKGETE